MATKAAVGATAPVIDSVTPAGPISAPVGAKVKLTVAGHDADGRTVNVTLALDDGEGNVSAPVVVAIQFTEALTLVASTDDGTPVSVSGLVATVG